jgi:hypothetical protein
VKVGSLEAILRILRSLLLALVVVFVALVLLKRAGYVRHERRREAIKIALCSFPACPCGARESSEVLELFVSAHLVCGIDAQEDRQFMSPINLSRSCSSSCWLPPLNLAHAWHWVRL